MIQCHYDEAGEFTDNLAPARVGSKWGYIDRSGNFVIPPQFEDAHQVIDGLAEVKSGGGTGVINSTGAWVWKPTK